MPDHKKLPPEASTALDAITATVRGRVQGVGFRYTTRSVAQRLGIHGWVRNRPDSSVEVLAQGTAAALEEFAAYLEQGPPGAVVTSVRIEPTEPDQRLERFIVAA